MLPAAEDFDSPISKTVETYYLGAAGMSAKERVGLYKLAWDLCGDASAAGRFNTNVTTSAIRSGTLQQCFSVTTREAQMKSLRARSRSWMLQQRKRARKQKQLCGRSDSLNPTPSLLPLQWS
jgi:aromatic ring hydroxylase